MVLRIIISLAMACISNALAAQFVLEGNITDAENRQPAIGATVYLPDLKKGTITNGEGYYRIENLPRGKFLIVVKSIGYSSFVQSVELKSSLHLDIQLASTITELNEVVVSGVSHSTELKKSPVPVTTLNPEDMVRNNSMNIIDNLSQKPGIYQVTTGVAIAKPVIRGLGYNRIITLYDGVRQEGQQWGDEHGIEIDEFSVDRVEIIKGAGSLMYGSDGIGGVINFLAPDPIHEGSIEGHWKSNYQTNNGLIANTIYNTGNISGWYWSARVSQKAAKAYQNAYDGRVLNSGFNENNYQAQIGLNRPWGFTQFTASSFNQQAGLTEGDRDAAGNFILMSNNNGVAEEVTASASALNTYALHIPKQRINHQRFSSSTNLFLNNLRLQLNLGHQRNLRKEFGSILDENEAELFFDLRTTNYNAIVYLPEIRGWNFSVGTSGMWQENRNGGEEFLIPEYHLWDWGIVTFAKKNFNKLDIAGGVRFDRRNIEIDALRLDSLGLPTTDQQYAEKFKAANMGFSSYSATAGLTYQFSEIFGTKANVSRGFRAPNISELASNGRHEGSLRYEYGSYDLKAENSFQTDLSFLINSPHISAEISLFQNTISNYIFVKKLRAKDGSDSIPDPEEPVPAYVYTQGKAQLTGGEFFMDLHPHPLDWIHFENSFSFVYAENRSAVDDSTRYLPFTPAPRLQSEIRMNAKRWKRFSNLFFNIQYQHYFKQDRVLLENDTESVTPSYSLWHAGCGFDILRRNDKTRLSLYFTVNNLFDKAYQHHLSRLKYAPENPSTARRGVFNMGRNFSVKVIVPVSFKKLKQN